VIEGVLAAAGCIAPGAEARQLQAAARRTGAPIETLVERRTRGEPLAWITGHTSFCGIEVTVDPGVYVPRPQTEELARRAAALLPADGVAVDLCTGAGAIAVVLQREHPRATVVASDIDPVAVTCAHRNDVTTVLGDLDEALSPELLGRVDVLTAVPPYVPTDDLQLLPRDVVAYEPRAALDGGADGTEVLQRIAERSVRWLRPGGWLLLELGGAQASTIRRVMRRAWFTSVREVHDAEGDARSIEGRS
jgi:release factor glutamine methyltransferase